MVWWVVWWVGGVCGGVKVGVGGLTDFHKRFPERPEGAPAYLLVAKTLANGMEQWEKATAFLTFIRKRCLTHPLHEQVDTYLEQAREKQPLRGPKASFGMDDNTL